MLKVLRHLQRNMWDDPRAVRPSLMHHLSLLYRYLLSILNAASNPSIFCAACSLGSAGGPQS